HSNSQIHSMLRSFHGNFLPFEINLAFVWTVDSSQDVHQGTLPSSILTETRMYFSCITPTIHIFIGNDTSDKFGDIRHCNYRFFHRLHPISLDTNSFVLYRKLP